MVDLGPLGNSELTTAQWSRLHLAFRVGAAGAETPVNLACCTARTPRGPFHGSRTQGRCLRMRIKPRQREDA
jgi:hypothetical protein